MALMVASLAVRVAYMAHMVASLARMVASLALIQKASLGTTHYKNGVPKSPGASALPAPKAL